MTSAEHSTDSQNEAAVIDRLIRARRTTKVLLSNVHRERQEACWSKAHSKALAQMVEGAGWAPFHRRAHEQTHRTGSLSAPMPWRFHVLEAEACTRLLGFLSQQADTSPDPKWGRAWQSKIKDMLSACGALVQATWLPDPAGPSETAEMTLNNIEHVAGAGAAVQNLLLAAQARSWQSYWSSGGILREAEVFEYLGIGSAEVLLGSIFLTPDAIEDANEMAGGLRDQRGDISDWARWVSPVLPAG